MSTISENEYFDISLKIENFLQKGFDNLTKEEDDELHRLTMLANEYENKHYPIPFKAKTIPEMLKIIMLNKKMKSKDMADLLDVNVSRLSEVLNEKRKVNLDLIKRIHQKLNIDGNVLLNYV